jgi:hypothetical protein
MPIDGQCRLPAYFHGLMDSAAADDAILFRADADSQAEFRPGSEVTKPGLMTRLRAALSRLSGLASCGFGAAACRTVETYEACRKAARQFREQMGGLLDDAVGASAGGEAGRGERKSLLSRRVSRGSDIMTAGQARQLLERAREQLARLNLATLQGALACGGGSQALARAIAFEFKDRWCKETPAVRQFFEADAIARGLGQRRSDGSVAFEPQRLLAQDDIAAVCGRTARLYEHLRTALPDAPLERVLGQVLVRGDDDDACANNLVNDARAELERMAAQDKPVVQPRTLRAQAADEGWDDAIRRELLAPRHVAGLSAQSRRAFADCATRLPLHPVLLEAALDAIADLGEWFTTLRNAALVEQRQPAAGTGATTPGHDHAPVRAQLDDLAGELADKAKAVSCDYDPGELRAWLLEASLEMACLHQGVDPKAAGLPLVIDHAKRHVLA